MSLNPSNRISENITGRRPFPNMAGVGREEPQRVDAVLTGELVEAGIPVFHLREVQRQTDGGEPRSIVIGDLHCWLFRRAWYYWEAKGPGIPPDDAMRLHAEHGTSVRVAGHCGCPSPVEWYHGFAVPDYHIDNQEGLNALAELIRQIHTRGEAMILEMSLNRSSL